MHFRKVVIVTFLTLALINGNNNTSSRGVARASCSASSLKLYDNRLRQHVKPRKDCQEKRAIHRVVLILKVQEVKIQWGMLPPAKLLQYQTANIMSTVYVPGWSCTAFVAGSSLSAVVSPSRSRIQGAVRRPLEGVPYRRALLCKKDPPVVAPFVRILLLVQDLDNHILPILQHPLLPPHGWAAKTIQ